jgi:D-glycero-D-manno-heptose 1,7-bisphosphate phosphatase
MNGARNKALLLDRDGVVNIEKNYVHRNEHFEFREGIFHLCRAAQIFGYLLVIVTNQAGIARGYYTEEDFRILTDWMLQTFTQHGISIARVYYCPFHPVHGIGKYKQDSEDRKPKPGMLLRAQADLNLDLTSSILVGDQLSDIEAASAAGVGTRILLCDNVMALAATRGLCHVANSLDEIRNRFFSTIDCPSTEPVATSNNSVPSVFEP